MSKTSLIISIMILEILFVISIMILKENSNIPQVKQEEIQCEHEFVVTSRYNILFSRYKTFSKCIKCGLEI